MTIPTTCIPGPVVPNPDALRDTLAQFDPDALRVYHEGTARLLTLHQLLAAQAELAHVQRTIAYHRDQLATLERDFPRALERALLDAAPQQPAAEIAVPPAPSVPHPSAYGEEVC